MEGAVGIEGEISISDGEGLCQGNVAPGSHGQGGASGNSDGRLNVERPAGVQAEIPAAGRNSRPKGDVARGCEHRLTARGGKGSIDPNGIGSDVQRPTACGD